MTIEIIENEKAVLKGAQAVWAANKYFVLACDQNAYQEIRQLLRQGNKELIAVYALLKEIDDTYASVLSEDLPQVSNALYHIAGYFKKHVSSEKRQEIDLCIKDKAYKFVLAELERLAKLYQVDYLLYSRLFASQRIKPFNIVAVSLKAGGVVYEPNKLLGQDDSLITYI